MNIMHKHKYTLIDKNQKNETDCCDCSEHCCLYCCVVMLIFAVACFIAIAILFPWVITQCSFASYQVPDTITGFMPQRISFSSCMNNWCDHSLMNNIKSDVHVFLGDNIYGDDYSYNFIDSVPIQSTNFITLPTHFIPYYKLMYNKLSCRATFQRFMQRTPYVLSIWDDHDYGSDDEKSENPVKYKTKRMFLDFWNVNNKRNEVSGVYGSYLFYDERNQDDKVLFILPDLHFMSTNARIFDDEQTDWLKSTIDSVAHEKSTRVIMCFSTPVSFLMHKYPVETDWLLQLLNSSSTVFVSGDPHHPSIEYLPYGHIEIISSPLEMCLSDVEVQMQTCNQSCSARKSQNNFGMLDLKSNVASIVGAFGDIITTQCFRTHNSTHSVRA